MKANSVESIPKILTYSAAGATRQAVDVQKVHVVLNLKVIYTLHGNMCFTAHSSNSKS